MPLILDCLPPSAFGYNTNVRKKSGIKKSSYTSKFSLQSDAFLMGSVEWGERAIKLQELLKIAAKFLSLVSRASCGTERTHTHTHTHAQKSFSWNKS